MVGIHAAMPHVHLVRRVITRAPELGGEDYDAVSVAQFDAMVRACTFALHWKAHGLRYGIPATVKDHLSAGTDCLVNFSRDALEEAAEIFQTLVVLNITAEPETLAHRLANRGRETAEQISARLRRASKPLPKRLNVIHVSNDGPLAETVARAVAQLHPTRV